LYQAQHQLPKKTSVFELWKEGQTVKAEHLDIPFDVTRKRQHKHPNHHPEYKNTAEDQSARLEDSNSARLSRARDYQEYQSQAGKSHPHLHLEVANWSMRESFANIFPELQGYYDVIDQQRIPTSDGIIEGFLKQQAKQNP
jgi:hypothetical protein